MNKKTKEPSDEASYILWKMCRKNELYTYEMFKDDLTAWFRKYCSGWDDEKEQMFEIDEENKRLWFIVPEKYRGRYSVMVKGF